MGDLRERERHREKENRGLNSYRCLLLLPYTDVFKFYDIVERKFVIFQANKVKELKLKKRSRDIQSR